MQLTAYTIIPHCKLINDARLDQAGEFDGAGSGQDVGQYAGSSAAAGFSAAPEAAGDVADLAFHHGAIRPDSPAARPALRGRLWRAAERLHGRWVLIPRPTRAFVQAARSAPGPTPCTESVEAGTAPT